MQVSDRHGSALSTFTAAQINPAEPSSNRLCPMLKGWGRAGGRGCVMTKAEAKSFCFASL